MNVSFHSTCRLFLSIFLSRERGVREREREKRGRLSEREQGKEREREGGRE